MTRKALILLFMMITGPLSAQSFYFGSDMSYVNEMEDCGVTYYEDGEAKDPYSIFADHGCNLVRLRLWHTPAWYDSLNQGKRYSDLADVKRAIARARQNRMQVLLDFHLSDSWADPSKQLAPAAWQPVVNNIERLQDSLYQYIFRTLTDLKQDNLLPEMIQIGNEVNKGILLSPEANKVWTLDWERNAALFKHAVKAVRDFEQRSGSDVKIVIHVAGPANAEWMIDGFISHGVSDFDIIGLSYYWAWHQPTSIAEAGEVIRTFRKLYPEKAVMVVETGYIWTSEWNDRAANIISDTHPDYRPASPENQRDWLIALTREVIASGGKGVIYWEPAWVSSPCSTQWGQGSHQEHATFFDFDNQLLKPGGIEWMTYAYDFNTKAVDSGNALRVQILSNSFSGDIKLKQFGSIPVKIDYTVSDSLEQVIQSGSFSDKATQFKLSGIPFGIYTIAISHDGKRIKSEIINYGKG